MVFSNFRRKCQLLRVFAQRIKVASESLLTMKYVSDGSTGASDVL